MNRMKVGRVGFAAVDFDKSGGTVTTENVMTCLERIFLRLLGASK